MGIRIDYDALYSGFLPILLKVALNVVHDMETAEEICQEAFIRLFERKIPFSKEEEVRFWLIRVVKNLSLNVFRKRKNEAVAVEKLQQIHRSAAPSAEELFSAEEEKRRFREAVDSLPDKWKEVLILKEFGEMNYKEIAKTLRISESNVKVRVFRAKEKLAEILNS